MDASVPHRPSTLSRVLGGLFAAVGVLRVASWAYDGGSHMRLLIAGMGFLLMAPAMWTGANAPTAPARLHRLRPISIVGVIFVLGSIAMRFV